MSRLKLVTIDKQALEPLSPIKPKKALVLAMGLVLGGILGVLIALVRTLLASRKRMASRQVPVLGSELLGEGKAQAPTRVC
jgi:capsular polysaccharide biosynthesis protein